MKTGTLIRKNDMTRNAVAQFERVNEKTVNYIIPVMTKAYDMRKEQTLIPAWKETILIDQNYQDFLQDNVLFMFELLDFSSDTKLARYVT
jgi:hypothetical protein